MQDIYLNSKPLFAENCDDSSKYVGWLMSKKIDGFGVFFNSKTAHIICKLFLI